MGSAWQRVCVPLEVESISLHRGPRATPRPRRRAGLMRRLVGRIHRAGEATTTDPSPTAAKC